MYLKSYHLLSRKEEQENIIKFPNMLGDIF